MSLIVLEPSEVDPSEEDRDAHWRVALEHRTVLGQATGIVMERYRLDAVRAWDVLLRVSSETETKVHEVAVHLVQTGKLPGQDEWRRADPLASVLEAASGSAEPTD